MATTKKAETTKETAENESEYTAKELAQNAAALFGTSHDVAAAALKMAGVKQTTVKNAKAIIEKFRKGE